jgi:hypothetical protein
MINHIIINLNIIVKRNQELENIMRKMIIRKSILREVNIIIRIESSSEPSSPDHKKKTDSYKYYRYPKVYKYDYESIL